MANLIIGEPAIFEHVICGKIGTRNIVCPSHTITNKDPIFVERRNEKLDLDVLMRSVGNDVSNSNNLADKRELEQAFFSYYG